MNIDKIIEGIELNCTSKSIEDVTIKECDRSRRRAKGALRNLNTNNLEGRNNEAKLKSIIEDIDGMIKIITMDALTPEQIEYAEFKEFEMLSREILKGSSVGCYPRSGMRPYVKTVNQDLFYLLIEMIQGEHNDFLQSIIDRSKDK